MHSTFLILQSSRHISILKHKYIKNHSNKYIKHHSSPSKYIKNHHQEAQIDNWKIKILCWFIPWDVLDLNVCLYNSLLVCLCGCWSVHYVSVFYSPLRFSPKDADETLREDCTLFNNDAIMNNFKYPKLRNHYYDRKLEYLQCYLCIPICIWTYN